MWVSSLFGYIMCDESKGQQIVEIVSVSTGKQSVTVAVVAGQYFLF